MTEAPQYGTCRRCGRVRRLRKDGSVFRHGDGSGAWPPRDCPGWGLMPLPRGEQMEVRTDG